MLLEALKLGFQFENVHMGSYKFSARCTIVIVSEYILVHPKPSRVNIIYSYHNDFDGELARIFVSI